ncbi:hypothetical protein [Methylorubrum thiocyanatum]|uniref:hypothetical protein n=1 Tax=Methylorubrum thiocyanatum TaxID=47958 RepID=UPI003F7D9473
MLIRFAITRSERGKRGFRRPPTMESAIKHGVWALSVVACVYFATTNRWAPFTLTISPQISVPASVQGQAAAPAPVAMPETRMFTEEDLRRALASQSAGQAPAAGSAPAIAAASPITAQSATLATIEDANVGRQVAGTLAKLPGVVDAPAGTKDEAITTIFFDPRCPFCLAAFKAMHGKVAAHWVPVLPLGDDETGRRMSAAILTAPDRLAALKASFEAKASGTAAPEAAVTPEVLAALKQNHLSFASVFAATPSANPGVPTLFVPRPDGRMAIMFGYSLGDDAKVATIMAGS